MDTQGSCTQPTVHERNEQSRTETQTYRFIHVLNHQGPLGQSRLQKVTTNSRSLKDKVKWDTRTDLHNKQPYSAISPINGFSSTTPPHINPCPENVVQWMSTGHFVQYEQGGNMQPDSYMHHWGSKTGPQCPLSLQVSWVTITEDPNHIPVTYTPEGFSKCSNNRTSWGLRTGRQVEGSSV